MASAKFARIAEKEDRQTLQLQLHLIEDQINQLRCVPTRTPPESRRPPALRGGGRLLENDPLLQTPGGGASCVPFCGGQPVHVRSAPAIFKTENYFEQLFATTREACASTALRVLRRGTAQEQASRSRT